MIDARGMVVAPGFIDTHVHSEAALLTDELGARGELLFHPAHPYTAALRSAVPEVDRAARLARIALAGEPSSAVSPPSGCVFHPRCPLCIDRCRGEVPELREVAAGRMAACHRAEEVLAGAGLLLSNNAVPNGAAAS